MRRQRMRDFRFVTPNAFAYGSTDGRTPNPAAVEGLLRVLREAGLLHLAGATYELVQPAAKIDITETTTYRQWRRLFQTNDFPPSSPAARR